jgi:hypothetical protein
MQIGCKDNVYFSKEIKIISKVATNARIKTNETKITLR